MRFLDYIVAGIVQGVFIIFMACLVGMAIGELINWLSGNQEPKPKDKHSFRPSRFWWLETLRARNHERKIDRLAASIERRLERKQREAEEWRNRFI